MMNAPLLVAHRGYAHRFPENTLEGLQAALEVGACLIEFDVQLTSDCVPVLFHDADLLRTGDRAARVLELSFQQLSEIEVNQRQFFGDRFTGVKVPRLASAIELLSDWPRARAFVEIKPEGIDHFGVERVLERISVDLASARSRCVLISSVSGFVSEARSSGYPEIGLVLTEWSGEARKKLDKLQPDYIFCNIKRIPAEIMLWPGPWKWVIYEIVSPSLALEWSVRGAEFVETMAIGEMLADPILGERSCRD